ncbi:hypothetical protein CEXT_568361 [Caerostris extrusa]|uniref:Uncharacterized protein n=1 Tax=Caerostris extrusa TaxID=172846 RepID=A0AAV4XYA2_CAEEX|nr:hypothetical protein CEXT_568361 [Caerostris extrusa]
MFSDRNGIDLDTNRNLLGFTNLAAFIDLLTCPIDSGICMKLSVCRCSGTLNNFVSLGTGVEGGADFPTPQKAPEITRRPAFNAGPGVAEKLYKSYPNVAFLNGHTDREEMFGCHGSRRDAAACRVSTSRLPRFYSSRYPGKKESMFVSHVLQLQRGDCERIN